MRKITSKKKLIMYGCSGMGVNMLNIIVGSIEIYSFQKKPYFCQKRR